MRKQRGAKRTGVYWKDKKPDISRPSGQIAFIEYWHKHKTDKEKDIRYYIEFRDDEQLNDQRELYLSMDKTNLEDYTLIRLINNPVSKVECLAVEAFKRNTPHLYDLDTTINKRNAQDW